MTRFLTSRNSSRKCLSRAAICQDDFGALVLPVSLLLALVVLVAAYVVFMNSLTRKTFDIKNLESAVSSVKQENKRLEVQIARQESMANLADRVAALGLVPTSRIEYVMIGSGEVALR